MVVRVTFALRTPQMQKHFLHKPEGGWIVGKCIQMMEIIVRAIRFISLSPALIVTEIVFLRRSDGVKGRLTAA